MEVPFEENGPSKGPFLTIRIRVPVADFERGLPYIGSRRRLNEFAVEAVIEKINRAAAYDKAARRRELATNAALLEPVIRELYKNGKLDFLKGESGESGGR